MSEISALILRLCPKGVEYRPLGELVKQNSGGGTPSRSKAEFWGGAVPWASVGDLSIAGNSIWGTRSTITELGLAQSSSKIVSAGDVVVAVKISPGRMKIAGIDLAINQDLRGLKIRDVIDARFLTYYFQTVKLIGNGTIVKGITVSELERVRVPVPPLEVQREIVRILDHFTELEKELKAELKARRRQYEHYQRDTFSALGSVRHVPLGELVGRLTTGKLDANAKVEGGRYPFFTCDAKPFLIDEFAFDAEAIIISGNGSQVGHINYYEGKFNAYQRTYVLSEFSPKVSVAFLLVHLKTYLREYIFIHSKKGSVPYITMPMLQGFRVPLPPLEEQERIVAILRQFDLLANDSSIGIPAEVAARRKQYEYYRDNLLTFRELAA